MHKKRKHSYEVYIKSKNRLVKRKLRERNLITDTSNNNNTSKLVHVSTLFFSVVIIFFRALNKLL